VATNITPKILLHEFALLQVTDVANVGAFLDWGLEKDLMVPFKEQRQKMQKGRWYVVYLDIDEKTDRLYASNKIEKRLQNRDLTITEGEEVAILVYQKTDMGFSVIINNRYKGLIFDNEVFQDLNIGEKRKGYVKKIREEDKIDISLYPIGYLNFNSKNSEDLYHALVENNGFMAITDKSPSEEIYQKFGISKKAFKRAVGDLYKQRKISIEAGGIKLV
jgi:predicted RNA-binding protein (virulence factor B family)